MTTLTIQDQILTDEDMAIFRGRARGMMLLGACENIQTRRISRQFGKFWPDGEPYGFDDWRHYVRCTVPQYVTGAHGDD